MLVIPENKSTRSIAKNVIILKEEDYYPFDIIHDNAATVYPQSVDRVIRKDSVIKLSLSSKYSKKGMHVFFRVCKDFEWDMVLILNNISFKPGIYYYNLSEFYSDDDALENKVDLSALDSYKVKKRALSKILQNDKCKI